MESETKETLDKLETMAAQVLDNAILRALCVGSETPASISRESREERLERQLEPRKSYRAQLREILKLAYLDGVRSVHRQLHGQPGIDDEMLDEAIEFHSRRDGDSKAVVL